MGSHYTSMGAHFFLLATRLGCSRGPAIDGPPGQGGHGLLKRPSRGRPVWPWAQPGVPVAEQVWPAHLAPAHTSSVSHGLSRPMGRAGTSCTSSPREGQTYSPGPHLQWVP